MPAWRYGYHLQGVYLFNIMKKSFILHIDSLGILDELTDEQAGQLFKLIADYHNPDKPKKTEITQLVNLAFYSFKNQFDRDLITYNNVVNRNRNNGKNGGRPRKNNPKKPKKADSDNDNDSDNVNDNKNNKNYIDLSFVDFEYLEVFELWLEYKKEKKQSYKSQKSLEICYKNLIKIANNDPEVARQIISNSIANNYSGLFPIKQNKDEQPNKFHNLINLYNQTQQEYANKPRTGKKFGEL